MIELHGLGGDETWTPIEFRLTPESAQEATARIKANDSTGANYRVRPYAPNGDPL
jgi:hypothetical protein